MKVPLPRGTPIDSVRLRRWTDPFYGYRCAITEGRIDRWLMQFRNGDRDLAARILDCVDFITQEQMAAAFRSILRSLNGWNRDDGRRRGKWRFVSFSSSSGESGDSMLHKFRMANNLSSRRYSDLFIHKSQLLLQGLRSCDTVVFIDDFSGTGDQACTTWCRELQELLPGKPRTYLVLVAVSETARRRIEDETEMSVYPSLELTQHDNIFSPTCSHFTAIERDTILRYCRIADAAAPQGYGNCGFVIVFAHNCPNNSISILHANNHRWEGLFRRSD